MTGAGGTGGGDDGDRDARPTVDERRRDGERPEVGAPEPAAVDTAAASDLPLAAGAAPDRYRRGDEIGRGGMGRVVEAVDTVLGRTVAVKEIRELDGDLARRFDREVRVTARLEHPSIVPVYDAGRSADGLPFYVMRRVTGRPLDALIAEAADLDGRLALIPNLLAAVDAVAHAHNRGVLHRDLKPANILVGDHGETLVIDWGLAKLIGEDDDAPAAAEPVPGDSLRTRFGTVFGTPGFMAPEQALALEVDARGDVYALGATLYYLLAGEPPWAGTAPTEILERVVEQPPPPITTLARGAPPELIAVVEQAMAHDRDRRYRDAGALGDDLRRFLRGQLVAAHSYSRRERFMRWLRVNRTAIAVGSAATVALIVVGVLSLTRIVRDRDRIAVARQDAVARARDALAARDLAQEQADGLLVENARAAVDRDPTYAVERLADLRLESGRWPAARAVAAAARARGIATAFPGQGEPPWWMAMSPDGTRVAAVSRGDVVFVHDLVHRTTTTVTAARRGSAVTWLGARLALEGDDGITLVDLDTGARTRLGAAIKALNLSADADGTAIAWLTDDDRAFVSDGGEPIELPGDGGPIEYVRISLGGKRAMVRGRTLRVLVRDGATWRAVLTLPTSRDAAFADDGSRFAARTGGGDLREWTIADTGATPGGRWPLGRMASVFYAGDRLMAEDLSAMQVSDFSRGGARPVGITLTQLPLPIVRIGDGELALTEGNELVLTTTDRAIRIPMPEIGSAIAARPGHPYVVVGTSAHVLVWDLRDVWPELVAPFTVADVLPLPPAGVLALGFEQLRAFDAAGAGHDLDPIGPVKVRLDAAGRLVQLADDGAIAVTDTTTGERSHLTIPRAISAMTYGPDAVIAVTEDRDVVLAPLHGGASRVVAHLDTHADWIGARDRWFAVLAVDRVWRGDGQALETAPLPEPPTIARFDADGTLYVAAGADVLRWSPRAPALIPFAHIEAIPAALEPIRGRTLSVIGNDRALYQVDLDDGTVRQALPASENPIAVAADGATAAGTGDDELIHVADLTTGERWTLPTRNADLSRAVPSAGGRWLYVLGPHNFVLRFPIDLPRDPAELRRWILGRTNGRAGAAGLVEWQLPTPTPLR